MALGFRKKQVKVALIQYRMSGVQLPASKMTNVVIIDFLMYNIFRNVALSTNIPNGDHMAFIIFPLL